MFRIYLCLLTFAEFTNNVPSLFIQMKSINPFLLINMMEGALDESNRKLII